MRLLLLLSIALILVIVYVRLLEKISLFYPAAAITATPQMAGVDFEDVYFMTEDHVRLNGWLIKAVKHPETAPTVIFCHGNAGNIGDRVEKVVNFHDLGLNVFIFDYRGYGRSLGQPTEQGVYRDAKAAYDYVSSRSDINKNKIIVYGASLGGVVAIDLASKVPVAALIADSTFSSAADMAKRIAPFVPSFLLTVKLDSESKIKTLKSPKLFIHSRDDETVPFRLGQKLYAAAPEPKEFLEIQGSHNEGYALSQQMLLTQIRRFLKENGLAP